MKKASDSGSSPAAVGVATKCETRTMNFSRLSIALRGVMTSARRAADAGGADTASVDTARSGSPTIVRLVTELDRAVAAARRPG